MTFALGGRQAVPRPCTVCQSPNRFEIDEALRDGASLRDVAGRFGTSESALDRHRDHIPRLAAAPENREETGRRDGRGRFLPGQSGNPGGRPRALADVQAIAAERTVEAIDKLTEIMRSGSEAASLRASEALLERAWGRPTQPIELPTSDGETEHGRAARELVEELERREQRRLARQREAEADAAAGDAGLPLPAPGADTGEPLLDAPEEWADAEVG